MNVFPLMMRLAGSIIVAYSSENRCNIGMVASVGSERLVHIKGKLNHLIPSPADKQVIAARIDEQQILTWI
jgi:hypothetical protein